MTNPIPDPQPLSFIDLLRISDRRYAPKQGSEEYISQEQVEELHAAIGDAQSAAEEAKRYRDSVWGSGAEQAISQAVSRYQSLAQQAVDNRVSTWEHERGDRIYAPITGSSVYATKREYSEILDAWNEAKEYAEIARDNADASGQAQVFAGQAEQSSLSASRYAQEARDARPEWAGDWNPHRSYSRSAFVRYDGVSYYALEPSTNRRPDTNLDHWQAVAERGIPGIVVSPEQPEHGEVWLNPSGDTNAFDLEGMARGAAESVLASKSDVGHTHTLNDIVGAQFTDNATPNGVAKRDGSGQLVVPSTPTRDDFAASKIYVDKAKKEAIDQVNIVGDQVNAKLTSAVADATTAAANAAIPAVQASIISEVNKLDPTIRWEKSTSLGTLDLDTFRTSGRYSQNLGSNAALARNYPVSGGTTSAGSLTVHALSSTSTLQVYECEVGVFIRRYSNGSWSPWQPMAKEWVRGSITSPTTVNDVRGASNQGVWGLGSGQASENGMPATVAYIIEVMQSGTITYQRATSMHTSPRTWQRRFYNSNWTAWEEIGVSSSGGSSPADSWVKGSLSSSANLENMEHGFYTVPSSSVATTLELPESSLGTFTHIHISSAYKRQYFRTEPTDAAPVEYRRTFYNGTWRPWAKLSGDSELSGRITVVESKVTTLESLAGGGGSGDSESGWAFEREGRERDMRRRVGKVVTDGRGAVALTFDHYTKRFMEFIWPALTERGLKATLALNSARHLDGRTIMDAVSTDTATNAQIKSWINTGRLEIANHTKTHKGATGFVAMHDEIINGKNELESALNTKVDTFIQPGYPTGDPNYDGFGRGYSTQVYYGTTAGRMIWKEHPCITGMISHPTDVLPIDGVVPIGTQRIGYDTSQSNNMAAPRAAVTLAGQTGGRTINFCHPNSIYADSSSNTTFVKESQFLSFLDFIVAEKEAGRLIDLTMREWSVATLH